MAHQAGVFGTIVRNKKEVMLAIDPTMQARSHDLAWRGGGPTD